ncbi:hypothetical protein B0H34DRAFT_733688 [Crassisporium funariophilum]|nr:hypothetical protein B0H34DRAFT_733688 [Crassisporium funariophilum]
MDTAFFETNCILLCHTSCNQTPGPSDQEITLIRKFIAPTHLETVFTNKNSKSNIDQKALAQYTNHVRAHDAILSSMQKIPSELLEEIFWHYVTSVIPWQHATRKDLPWALTQVCQRWRAIALGVPSFWSHIPTINLPDKRRETQSTIKFLNELLTRSGNAPLTFIFTTPYFMIPTQCWMCWCIIPKGGKL